MSVISEQTVVTKCARNHTQKASASKPLRQIFLGCTISDETASSVTRRTNNHSACRIREVDVSSDDHCSGRGVDDSLDDSSDRASQLKALIELEIRD